jgi:hypothetical protein
MIDLKRINNVTGDLINFEKVDETTFRVKAPFFHEDGDAYEIYLKDNGNGNLQFCDFGLSLMRLSYTYDIETKSHVEAYNKVLSQNLINNDNGNLVLDTNYQTLFDDLMQYYQGISKVTNLDILNQQAMSTMFREYVKKFITEKISSQYTVTANYKPFEDIPTCIVDYAILKVRLPVYIFLIKDNLHAERAAFNCVNLKLRKVKFWGVGVYENFDTILSIDRNNATNALDKQFSDFSGFQSGMLEYVEKLASA